MGIGQRLSTFLRGQDGTTGTAGAQTGAARLGGPEASEPSNDAPVTEGVVPPPPPTEAGSKSPRVKTVTQDEALLSVLDLRELPSRRFRIVGSAYWVTDSGRYKHGGSDYLLVREPGNKADVSAVAVYGKGRKVGYLSQAKALALAPILDQVPYDAFRVGGAPPSDNSITMWVDIPALQKLRDFVAAGDSTEDS